MAGEQILIVDDTPVNLKLTRILLVNEGYKVLTASSGEEALELVEPALAVLAQDAPDENVARLAAQAGRYRRLPRVWALTCRSDRRIDRSRRSPQAVAPRKARMARVG